MTRSGILDTNTVILLSQLEDPEQLPEQPVVTAITLAELSVGPMVAKDDAERARRQAHLQQAEARTGCQAPFSAASHTLHQ